MRHTMHFVLYILAAAVTAFTIFLLTAAITDYRPADKEELPNLSGLSSRTEDRPEVPHNSNGSGISGTMTGVQGADSGQY